MTIPPTRPVTIAGATVADAMAPPELQISDDAAVDQALDVLHCADVGHLLVRADDGRCAGLVTNGQLSPYRDDLWYMQRIRIRDIVHDVAPFARPDTSAATALATMRARGLQIAPVVDDDGCTLGIVTVGSLRAVLAGPAVRASVNAAA